MHFVPSGFVPSRRLLLIACLLLAPLSARAQQAGGDQPVTVFAAASLTDAMKDVDAAWQKAGHKPLVLSFAASSTLARQIENGAPANIFASADEKWMDYLAGKNLIAADTRKDLLGNDLVLVVPANKPAHVTIGPGFDLAKLLGPAGRLAVGDPAHVPAGIYAAQALRKLGLWDSVQGRLASADDVRSALLLVERGEAPAGIVYGTDAAVSKGVMVAGTFPASSHDPVSYPFAVTKAGDTKAARDLLTFLAGPVAEAIFVKRGFKVE
jgi:molybdate transport system substrate-binding protein